MALNNGQYNEVMKIYEARQRKNRALLEQRRQKIYEAVPRVADYETAISEAAAGLARAALLGHEQSEKAKRRLNELREERKMLLIACGYSPEDMEMTYDCPLCKDTGMAGVIADDCQQEIALLYRESGLERELEKENFDTFTDRYYDSKFLINRESGLTLPAYMPAVADRCRQFAHEFKEKGGNLLFTGPAGVGKTFLTHCIAKDLIEQSVSVVYMSAVELTDTMAAARVSGGEDAEAECRAGLIRDCELLIIDDLGTELNNSMTNMELFRCLDERLKRGQSTVISTNLSPNELRDTYADRIVSRINSAYQIIRFFGPDIREIKKYS